MYGDLLPDLVYEAFDKTHAWKCLDFLEARALAARLSPIVEARIRDHDADLPLIVGALTYTTMLGTPKGEQLRFWQLLARLHGHPRLPETGLVGTIVDALDRRILVQYLPSGPGCLRYYGEVAA